MCIEGKWSWEEKNEPFTFYSISFLNVKRYNEKAFMYYSYILNI